MTQQRFVRHTLTLDPGAYDRAVGVVLDLATTGWQESADGRELTFWLAEEAAGVAVTAALDELASLGVLSIIAESDDWRSGWRRFHRSVRVGRITVRPPWLSARPDTLDVVVQAGMAFGTGTHATTRQCLSLLQELPRGSALDVGTGSGVLALAALRLGFAPVHACDNDAAAIEAAAGNAAANGLAPVLFAADVNDSGVELPVADVVLANIALGPIVALGRRLDEGRLVPPAHLVLAGLLADQADEARAAFPGYAERGRLFEGEWVALRLDRV